MKLILIIFALITLTILSSAITPADVVRQNKMGGPLALDLRNTNPAVFNTTAFANQNPNPGHYKSSNASIAQSDVGIPNSDTSFLNGLADFGFQDVTFKVDTSNKIIHGNTNTPAK
jgi:hypothetical protein